MDRITGKLTGIAGLSGVLSAAGGISGGLSRPSLVPVEKYDGPYEFTPSAQTQVIPIAEKKALANIIIKPVPQNYGRITWNGSVLTVS